MRRYFRFLLLFLLTAVPLSLPSCASAGEPLYAVREPNGLWGYIDRQGVPVIPGTFTYAEDFRGGYAVACRYPDGFALPEGEETQPLYRLSSGEYMRYTGLEGIINARGEWIVPPEYFTIRGSDEIGQYIGGLESGLYLLEGENTYGFFDIPSGFFSGAVYEAVFTEYGEAMDPELIGVVKDRKTGFVRRSDGETVIPCRYAPKPAYFHEDRCIVSPADNPSRRLIIDRQGRETPVPESLKAADDRFSGGLLPVMDRSSGLYGYLDKEGQIAVTPQFTQADPFHEGRAVVTAQSGIQAVIGPDGQILFSAKDVFLWPAYDHGLIPCPADDGRSFVFLDRDGAEAFTLSADGLTCADPFGEDGIAWYYVRTDSPFAEPFGGIAKGLFSSNGEILTPPVFWTNDNDETEAEFTDGPVPAVDLFSGSAGYIDEHGQWLARFENGYCRSFRNGLAQVDVSTDSGRKVIFINLQGSEAYSYTWDGTEAHHE